MTEYLIKPVSAEKLRRRVVAVFTNPRSFVATERYVGPDRRRREAALPNMPSRRLGDRLGELAPIAPHNEEAPSDEDFRAVLKTELARLARFAQQIDDSGGRTAESWTRLQRIAHDLRGQAGSFGFTVVSGIAQRLDRLASPVLNRAELMLVPTERRISAVQRHVDALRMIFEQNIRTASPETDALLERLDKAIERVEREALEAASGACAGMNN
ncbi:Hpt domain-containing protein [Nisaea sp.]|uniref:Hpt domain-containing protein n=1 Tax=Nisaea sp. TaxID=2024842 RepID=UPI0032EEA303